ncbi:membrane-bound PQQ-dependent dehydrogenase, glucose/quinate/shikimate family [Verticiella sediminum]|uniref:Membrane-bound PQQ-dependent dehydrogenase, glucose/quinate/shikimate family n=1 Tax=Verticiella sediminum TaxID=1247510 RepID=A0A556A7P9_9BURK|nr:membrane-bound PQQ-dependent dehydrogenase, glucose/quinate/shikimate family [Verticiella sediminum]TSH88903.1 membrane-bound PQQ-dependent dehydrogenase, glucose/quinate/shikimate family [Verticiella sediminum]
MTSLFGVILVVIGIILLVGGVRLVSLEGSWYYLLAGAALLLSGLLYLRARVLGAWLFAIAFVGTAIWTIAEVGMSFWGWVPRMAPMLVLGLVAALLVPRLTGERCRMALAAAAAQAVLIVIGAVAMFFPHGVVSNDFQVVTGTPAVPTVTDPADPRNRWQFYGNTTHGTRYAPYAQITPDNVESLEVAWTFRTGEMATKGSEYQNTPIQIGDTLYLCTPLNKVFALNAETGEQRWMFDPQVKNEGIWNRCRGVAYYEVPALAERAVAPAEGAPPAPAPLAVPAMCESRVYTTTLDARLIALDARTGEVCTDFGQDGAVDLKDGLGNVPTAHYMPTSQPLVVRDRIIIGGWVFDGRQVDMPSGVVRAFDARTGDLSWAWDLGNPGNTGLPADGETYTRGTPNFWSTAAYDEKLGLIYLPTGNQTPDFWGAQRPAYVDDYSTSVVAIDVQTGREAWKFQTVHHDIWDYDNGTQPALYDIPDGKGGSTPALVLGTKTAQLYVLDRRNGAPIREVESRPVPTDAQPGERPSPVQPFSVGMPAPGADAMTEQRMWGATFFDQLYCRIEFRKLRHAGPFTPVTEEPTLIWPGFYGGYNWGGVAIDENQGMLVVNDIRMPQIAYLVPQKDVDEAKGYAGHGFGVHPQAQTPYAAFRGPFNSPLGIPCHQPPWGTLAGIDLKSAQLIWERPLGSIQDTVLKGVRVPFAVPVGMPTLGGPITTASGLSFYAGTQDFYLRAFDTYTGNELWKSALPVGAQAAPMSYLSPESGRQFVVINAGGSRDSPVRGDYFVAYALPKQ